MPKVIALFTSLSLVFIFLLFTSPVQAEGQCIDGYLDIGEGVCQQPISQNGGPVQQYYLDEDPGGVCPWYQSDQTSTSESRTRCVAEYNATHDESGQPMAADPCISKNRPMECRKDPDGYRDDICKSAPAQNPVTYTDVHGEEQFLYPKTVDKNGNAVYDSNKCRAERGKEVCDDKPDSEGWVYVRAFGQDPETSCVTFLGFTKSLINYAMLIATLVAAYMFMMGGFKYTMSRGNPAGLIEARDQIMHATIGLVLLAVSYIVILILQDSFGFLHLDLVGPFGYLFAR